MDYLRNHKDTLLPEFRKIWEAAGSKASGSWEEVFGKGPAGEEVFMGWNYARYVGRVAGAGKAEYAIPMFVNAWRVQPNDKTPGDYPSGGPQAHMHDLWRAGAPQIDILSPDVQSLTFPAVVAQYTRSGNPLFIPESRGDAAGAANVFYAVGQHNAIGYSVFGLDLTTRLFGAGPGASVTPQASREIESLPLPKSYALLSQMAPLILEHQAKGTIAAAWLSKENTDQKIQLGNYTLDVGLTRNRRAPNELPERGYGIFIAVGPDEYVIAGNDVQVIFSPNTPGPEIAGLASVKAGTYVDGRWIPGRRLAGDDCVLRYDLAAAAANNQSGSGVRFRGDGPSIQRVKLYRYR
jgi:hypothetical protein